MLVWLEDIRLNAVVTGPESGPPLVLIHGLGLDLALWDGLMPQLAAHRVLRLDLRGHGGSDAPRPRCAMGALIRDVERLMQHFALTGAVVLGQGEGGLLAQGLAIKRLDLVRAMILAGSASRFATPDHWARRISRRRDAGPAPDAACAALLGPRWRQSPAVAPVRAMLARTSDAGWAGFAAAIATADFHQATARLTLPSLILAGGDDRHVPPDLQRETAGLIAGAEFTLLLGACHLAMLADPDPFAAALLGFLARIGHV